MAKEEASVVSVKGNVGSAGCSTGACVKAFLRLLKAVSWACDHVNGLSFFKRSVRVEAVVEK